MRSALITGASDGIGLEIAKLLSVDYEITLVARSSEKLEKAKASLSNSGHTCVVADLTTKAEVDSLKSLIEKNRYDVFINNAGVGMYGLFHEMPLSEAQKRLDHLGSCSPCYGDFSRFREAHERGRRRTSLAIAASILLVATVAGWAFLRNRNENLATQTAVLDLRNRSVARGTGTNQDEPPLELTRRAKSLKILLPLGSNEGPYDVRIVTLSGEERAASSGIARLNEHITALEVVLPRDSLRSGKYLLQLRKPQLSWESYSLMVR